MKTLSECLQWGQKALSASETPSLDAKCLLMAAAGVTQAKLMAYPDEPVAPEALLLFKAYIARRERGEPVALILGTKAFWNLELKVTQDTLVPRPDTETVVEAVLERFDNTPLKLVDLGTGSGAIALSLGKERPAWDITATDIHPKTLAVAKANAKANQIKNVKFVEGAWFAPLAGQQFDVIVSNPPYIKERDSHLSALELQYEPLGALASGPDGLRDLTHIIELAPHYLKPGGFIALEHGFDQANQVQVLLKQHGFLKVETLRDLAGVPRVTLGWV